MAELSQERDSTPSNRLQAGLRAVATSLSATSLDVLAEAIGKDDSTVCRIRGSEEAKVTVADAVRLLYAAGLKVVSADKVCVDRARYEAMVVMASAAMSDQQTVRRLTWDE